MTVECDLGFVACMGLAWGLHGACKGHAWGMGLAWGMQWGMHGAWGMHMESGSEIRSADFPAFHFRVFGGAPPPLQ